MTEVRKYVIFNMEVNKMITKMTIKNQITIPKKILERMGLCHLRDEERYFDVEIKDNSIFLKPVIVVIEERIPEKQWRKFEDWAVKVDKNDKVFDSAEDAVEFLRKRIKKR